MFQIEYSTKDNLKEEVALLADEVSLRYSVFLGSIIFKFKTHKIDLDWGWIPLLDLAYSLVLISSNLLSKESAKEEFEFTESDGILLFEKKGDSIEITTSFSDESLMLSFNSFKKGVYSFYYELLSQIKNSNEKIIDNPNFKIYEDKLNHISV